MRINMEIIRNLWKKEEVLKDVVIVHSYDGKPAWWPEKYLEDELITFPSPGHFLGCEIALDKGMECFAEKYPDVEYVITLASDTWLVKLEYVANLVKTMQKEKKYPATAPWGNTKDDDMWKIGVALDFNIINAKWAQKYGLFPIRYSEFLQKYAETFYYHDETVYLERVLALRFKQAILKSEKIPSENLLKKVAKEFVYRMTEREPVHDERGFFGIKKGRKMYWPHIGLLTHHESEPKQKIMRSLRLGNIGEHTHKLVSSSDLSYFNNGTRKTAYIKDGKKVDYGD